MHDFDEVVVLQWHSTRLACYAFAFSNEASVVVANEVAPLVAIDIIDVSPASVPEVGERMPAVFHPLEQFCVFHDIDILINELTSGVCLFAQALTIKN